MSKTDLTIDRFLNTVKADGMSSPAGMHWQRFYEFLRAKKQIGWNDPPLPLILAASGESDGSKHRRLSNQLEWALENGCRDEAIRYLQDMTVEQWNSCPLERWEQDSYWSP
ncbi:MAG TPA: hypothetical protein VIT91_21510 [Chthoniobacterales bacterium]